MARRESIGTAIAGFAFGTALTLLPGLWLADQTLDALRTTTLACDHAAGDACDIEVSAPFGSTRRVPNDAITSVDVGAGGGGRGGWHYTLTLDVTGSSGTETLWLGHPDSEEHVDAWVDTLWTWHTDPSATPVRVTAGERSWLFALTMGVFAVALLGMFLGILWGMFVGWGPREKADP